MAQSSLVKKTITCPACSAVVPIDPGYRTWCDQCGWNLGVEEEKPRGAIAQIYDRLGSRQGRSLLEEFQHSERLKPRLTLSKVLAYGLAGLIHLVTLALPVVGIWLVVANWPYLFFMVLGVLCLILAWMLRPRFAKMPSQIAAPSEVPGLYALVNRIADAIGAPPVDAITITPSFNASFAQIGIQRTRVLEIGLPLWEVLADQERIALLGHELAHAINGDSSRGLIVGSALRSLATWHYVLKPDQLWDSAAGLIGVFMVPVNLIMAGVAKGIDWLFSLLIHLLWRDSQRAEYLADYVGATAAGSDAMIRLLNELAIGATFWNTLQRTALAAAERTIDFFDELRNQVALVPARERERIRRVMELEQSRLDATHPPTLYRIEMLMAHPIASAKTSLSSEQSAAIDREFAPLRQRTQKELVDLFRQTVYA